MLFLLSVDLGKLDHCKVLGLENNTQKNNALVHTNFTQVPK